MNLNENVTISWEEVKEYNKHMTNAEKVFMFVEKWTAMMEELIAEGNKVEDILLESASQLSDDSLTQEDFNNALAVICDAWKYSDDVLTWYEKQIRKENMEVLGLTEEEYDALSEEEINDRIQQTLISSIQSVLNITEEEMNKIPEEELHEMYNNRIAEIYKMQEQTMIYNNRANALYNMHCLEDGANINEVAELPKQCKIDTGKIQTLDDVIAIINALDIKVTEGSEPYELLKHLI